MELLAQPHGRAAGSPSSTFAFRYGRLRRATFPPSRQQLLIHHESTSSHSIRIAAVHARSRILIAQRQPVSWPRTLVYVEWRQGQTTC